MELDIRTLAFVQSLIFVTQVIVLFIQHRIDRASSGIGWWVLGSACMSAGVSFMLSVNVKSLIILALISHPLVILGHIFFYIGVMRFFNRKENRYLLGLIYTAFIILYFYFMSFNNNLSARTLIICSVIALISLMIASETLVKKDILFTASARFTGAVFLVHACFFLIRDVYTLVTPQAFTYSDLGAMMTAVFILPTITSVLWTFGFIIMLNHRLNIEIQESEEKYRSILNASPDDITITDLHGNIVMVSPASKKMFGYDEDFEAFIGMNIIDFLVPEDVERAKTNLTRMGQDSQPKPNEYIGVRKDLSTFHIEVNSGFIHDPGGKPTKMVFVIRDITERKLAEQRIRQLVEQLEHDRNTAHRNSITDSLTGLANRRFFDDMLTTEFYRLKRSDSNLSLIMLDVDYFKKFNDSKGHLAGDECLRQIGNVLKSIVGRTTDVVARYGGEEFVVILPDTKEEGAVRIAEEIRTAVIDLAIPHPASAISDYITVSIGVTTVSTNSASSPEQVISLVDEALYLAKNGGRNQIQVNIKNRG